MISVFPTIGIAMPTDADWGRLYKYNTNGDAGLVMPFRSYYFRDFFSGGWTNLAVGLIYRNAGNTGDNSNVISERQVESTMGNLFHFGLSKSNGRTILVSNNTVFMGLRGYIGGITQITAGVTPKLGQLTMTLIDGGSYSINGSPIEIPIQQGTPANPFSMIGIRFVHNPLTGVLTMRYAQNSALSLASDTANITTLTDFLTTISNEQAGANATFSGVWNVTNFKSYYIYWPYLRNKMMLHCVGAIKT